MELDYIEIDKKAVPYKFDIQLNNITYTFEVNYNAEYDFFTIDLYKDDEVLVLGEKLVYGKPLFEGVKDDRFPEDIIVPLDISGKETRVSYDNLGQSVFLFVFNKGDIIE